MRCMWEEISHEVHQWFETLRRPCRAGSIVVQVVDVCRTTPCPATLILSNKAFNAIARFPTANISTVEFAQLVSLPPSLFFV